MLRKPIAILALMCVACSAANSQELHEWKSKTGHTTRAALFKVDEERRKVTLLIPKEIDFDRLDPDSIALARKLAPAGSEDVKTSPKADPKRDEMRFLQTKYEQLTEFKTSSGFAEWGFAGGPYALWLNDVQKATNSKSFESADVAFAIGHLLTLGLEYKDSKGKETEYARFANDCIQGILDGQPRYEFEKRAIAKVQSIVSGRPGASKSADVQGPPQYPALTGPLAGDTKYAYSIYSQPILVFESGSNLVSHWSAGWPANPSAQERSRLGIKTLAANTTVKIVSKHHSGLELEVFLIEVLAGSLIGEHVYIHADDLCDTPQ